MAVKRYTSTSPQAFVVAVLLQRAPWYGVGALNVFSNYLDRVDMSSQTSRHDAYLKLLDISETQPYAIPDDVSGLNYRFGSNAQGDPTGPSFIYVCRNLGYWQDIFENFSKAFTSPVLPDFNTDPAVPLFYDNLEQFRLALSSGYTAFNFLSFEAYFGLTWS